MVVESDNANISAMQRNSAWRSLWLFIQKKFFGHFTLTPSHLPLEAPVYRDFEGEG